MVTDKSYNLITKTVNNVIHKLETNNISHEVVGDKFTFAISPTCTIHTDQCTIDIHKDQINVNENRVSDLDEMIDVILEVEQ